MTKPRYIAWYGGKRPAKENQDTERLYRSGRTYDFHNERGSGAWEHLGDSHDIIAYRVIEQE
jgi:hypothetical protein